jgi:hypothetical protein
MSDNITMTHSLLKYYQSLPETMPIESVRNEINTLLDTIGKESKLRAIVFNALYELADRQYHTYSHLDRYTKDKIIHWLLKNWELDEVLLESIGMIVGGVGLPKILQVLKKNRAEKLPQKIKDRLDEIINEIEPHCNDPYHDLR